jgi:hypothetical protein
MQSSMGRRGSKCQLDQWRPYAPRHAAQEQPRKEQKRELEWFTTSYIPNIRNYWSIKNMRKINKQVNIYAATINFRTIRLHIKYWSKCQLDRPRPYCTTSCSTGTTSQRTKERTWMIHHKLYTKSKKILKYKKYETDKLASKYLCYNYKF